MCVFLCLISSEVLLEPSVSSIYALHLLQHNLYLIHHFLNIYLVTTTKYVFWLVNEPEWNMNGYGNGYNLWLVNRSQITDNMLQLWSECLIVLFRSPSATSTHRSDIDRSRADQRSATDRHRRRDQLCERPTSAVDLTSFLMLRQ